MFLCFFLALRPLQIRKVLSSMNEKEILSRIVRLAGMVDRMKATDKTACSPLSRLARRVLRSGRSKLAKHVKSCK